MVRRWQDRAHGLRRAGFPAAQSQDDQFYRIVDVSDPPGRWRPVAGGIPVPAWATTEPQPQRLPEKFDTGFRAHNTNVFPQRPDRAYVGYIDGGAFVLDISDRSISRWCPAGTVPPPNNGFHAYRAALFERDLWIVSDECVQDDGADWPKLVWVVNAKSEAHPLPIGTFPMPPVEAFAKRGGRFGAHNLHENLPLPVSFQSDTLIVGTFFNGGVRV